MSSSPLLKSVLVAATLAIAAPAAYAVPANLIPRMAQSAKPVPFEPIKELKDKSGRVLKLTDMVTAPNGKKVTAKQYLDALNSLKKRLNQAGFRLRNGRANIVGAVKVDRTPKGRSAAILKAHSAKMIQRRPLAEQLARFQQRTEALKNPAMLKDAKVKKAFPNLVKHFGQSK